MHFGLTETFHVVYFVGLESVLAIAFAVTGLIVAWHRPATPGLAIYIAQLNKHNKTQK